jgi:hypothetical protein
LSIARDARRALREGPAAIAERQRARLAEIVAYARANSPYDGIDRLLTDSKAEHVAIERAQEPPQPAPSGKYRRVVPFSA